MKNRKIAEALGEIDQSYIAQASNVRHPGRGRLITVVVTLLLVVFLGILWGTAAQGNTSAAQGNTSYDKPPVIQGSKPAELGKPTAIVSPDKAQFENLIGVPTYPQMVQMPIEENYANKEDYASAKSAWYFDQHQQYSQPEGYADSLSAFWHRSLTEFLSCQSENAVCSPVNIYLALAMLAETAEGNSRQQILDLFGADSMEALRTQASHVWNAHYSADGATTTVLANSIWLDQNFAYKQVAVDTLAQNYYASIFHGKLGSKEMNRQLRQWIDSQTGNLLQEQTAELELDPGTAMALASTLYFSATWESEFSQERTSDAIFHSAGADIKTQFMNKTFHALTYYKGTNFGAIGLEMTGENTMWLILPDKGKTVDDVLTSEEYMQMCTGIWKDKTVCKVHLSLPKFDISGQMDLVEGMNRLGITDVFDPTVSDFGAISEENLYVSKIDHACRVAVDEEGCVAAGYTMIEFRYGDAMPDLDLEFPEIHFTMDRPFLFVVTSRDSLPLFAGVVNRP